MPTDQTHDPALQSWVESANDPATDFPIQNLPLCMILREHAGGHHEGGHHEGDGGEPHVHEHLAVAIGDSLLDVTMLVESGYFSGRDELAESLLSAPDWTWVAMAGEVGRVRRLIQDFLRADAPAGQQARRLRQKCLVPIESARFAQPVAISEYTDFYASIHHATAVGSMFRPDQPLLPNYKHVPIGYHGRASSIAVSPGVVTRPRGQASPPDDRPGDGPSFGPCRMLDYELEVGAFVARGNDRGSPIPVGEAGGRLLGVCLVNDWSARDIQKWEYQPLGPFLAKNFATTISPFIVTMEALGPFRCPAAARPAGDPGPLPYLADETDRAAGGLDLTLEAWVRTAEMARRGMPAERISRSRAFREMYWTLAQLLAHHTSNGCPMRPGDLIASGTVSGPGPSERGCLLELTWQGRGPDGKPMPRKPIELPTGEKRIFLEDGDEVILRGYAERDGFRRIGLGECRATIIPSPH